MANIVIAMSKPEECSSIRNILARSGYRSSFVCLNGAQAIAEMDGLDGGIVICSYKLADMLYSELKENMPKGFEMLILAPQKLLVDCYGNDIVCLAMPLKVDDLISTVGMVLANQARIKKKERLKPKQRSEEEIKTIREAKELLMSRNHMDEEEAHRYMQKNSMDSGNSLLDTAKMILAMLKNG